MTAPSSDADRALPPDVTPELLEAFPPGLRSRLLGKTVTKISAAALARFHGARLSALLPWGDARLLCGAKGGCCGELGVLELLRYDGVASDSPLAIHGVRPWHEATLSLPLGYYERYSDDGTPFDPPWFRLSDRYDARSRRGDYPALRRQRQRAELVDLLHRILWERHRAAVIHCPTCDGPNVVNHQVVSMAFQEARVAAQEILQRGKTLEGEAKMRWILGMLQDTDAARVRTLAVMGYQLENGQIDEDAPRG